MGRGPMYDVALIAGVAVLVGTDVGLFRKALVNLKEDKAGLAGSKAMAAQAKQTDAARKVEMHVSAMLATMLATAQDLEQPGKAAAGSLSSAPCDSPFGDNRIAVRSAPTSATTRSMTSRINRIRFSGAPP